MLEYLPGLLQDTKSCSGNRAKMLHKSHHIIKCHCQYKMVIDSFSTVPPIVNAGDWGCILRDLETIIVLVLLSFNFIPQRSHQSQTLMMSRLRDSATATLTPAGMAHQLSRWSYRHNRSAYFQNRKNSEVYRRSNNGPKTLLCGTPDATLTSLLWQPFTIMCCEQFDRNSVNIDNTEPPIPTELSRIIRIRNKQRILWRWTLSKAVLKSIYRILASCQLSNALCSIPDRHKSDSQVPRPFR